MGEGIGLLEALEQSAYFLGRQASSAVFDRDCEPDYGRTLLTAIRVGLEATAVGLGATAVRSRRDLLVDNRSRHRRRNVEGDAYLAESRWCGELDGIREKVDEKLTDSARVGEDVVDLKGLEGRTDSQFRIDLFALHLTFEDLECLGYEMRRPRGDRRDDEELVIEFAERQNIINETRHVQAAVTNDFQVL